MPASAGKKKPGKFPCVIPIRHQRHLFTIHGVHAIALPVGIIDCIPAVIQVAWKPRRSNHPLSVKVPPPDSLLLPLQPPSSTLFPYTTLFRSQPRLGDA